MSILVLAPGLLSTVQDDGREGHASVGVGNSGAMDSVALRLANALVGNRRDAAALEFTLRGPRLQFDTDALIAITGAEIDAHCNGEPIPPWRPVALRAGSELHFGGMRCGMRVYLSIAGGLDTACVLGSRSTDLNGGLGVPALASGDILKTVQMPTTYFQSLMRTLDQTTSNACIVPAKWSIDPTAWFDNDRQRPIRVIPGAHFSRLDEPSRRALFANEFQIGSDSNRVGYRLAGNTLTLRDALELVSEGVVAGTVQLPASGDPIVLMAEAPTCGGYPRIAQVIRVDLPRLAQRRPGEKLQFVETSLDDAQTRYLERERALTRLEHTIRQRLQCP